MLLKRSFILMALCLVAISRGYAQQEPAPQAPNENAESSSDEELQKEALEKAKVEKIKADQIKAEQAQQKENVNKGKPPEEVFKPTEEISEDSPVPFPVDI